jgi:septum site-determining protein MinD
MKTIAFYSYKGGVGRSLALANISVILAKKGKNVGIIDLDVESPGQHLIFNIKPKSSKLELLHLIKDEDMTSLEEAVVTVYEPNILSKGSGALYLLPTVSQAETIDFIKWDEKSSQMSFLNQLIDSFAKIFSLDYLLIDTRTGISSPSSMALWRADRIFLLYRLDRQNLEGIKILKRASLVSGTPFIAVATFLPNSKRAKDFLVKFSNLAKLEPEAVIPYDLNLALDESLITLTKPRSCVSTIYKKISTFCEEKE